MEDVYIVLELTKVMFDVCINVGEIDMVRFKTHRQ